MCDSLWRPYRFVVFLITVTLLGRVSGFADAEEARRLYQRAISAYHAGKVAEAQTLLEQSINQDEAFADAYMARGYLHQYQRKYQEAASDFGQVIQLDPSRPEAWFRRAIESFNLGKFKESVADFERFAQLDPSQKPHLWQLGIAYFYTGQHQEGRALFESHQTVNSRDVENAVWHFLCVAAIDGVDVARSLFIDIQGDRRVPMMEVWALFKGVGSEEAVLKAAHGESADATQRIRHSFYASLYLGLYYQALSDESKALEYMKKATQHYKSNGYMGEVARVHRDWLLARQVERSSHSE